MKIFKGICLGIMILTSSSVFGHGAGHAEKPIMADEAKVVATKVVDSAVKKGQLEKTWSEIKANEPTTKDFGHGPEWLVTFDNPKVTDKKKSKLSVFLSIGGEPLGLNFTGK